MTDWGLILQSYTRQNEKTITRCGYFLSHLDDSSEKYHVIVCFFPTITHYINSNHSLYRNTLYKKCGRH